MSTSRNVRVKIDIGSILKPYVASSSPSDASTLGGLSFPLEWNSNQTVENKTTLY